MAAFALNSPLLSKQFTFGDEGKYDFYTKAVLHEVNIITANPEPNINSFLFKTPYFSYLMKFVISFFSTNGNSTAPAEASFILSRYSIFFPRILIVCNPSKS